MVTGGVASGCVAGALLGLDSVVVDGPDVTVCPGASGRRVGVRRRVLSPERVVLVDGLRCTSGLQTLVDIACELDDLAWEQALESALRKGLTTVAEVGEVARLRVKGADRIRRVLSLRPPGAPPTESLLETLMIQLARRSPALAPPVRQYVVRNRHGEFVAKVDLCWPQFGVFIELDGQHHKDQPVYDARRQTAVSAVTGWLCGRFTWKEVVDLPATTLRRLAELVARAQER